MVVLNLKYYLMLLSNNTDAGVKQSGFDVSGDVLAVVYFSLGGLNQMIQYL